MDSEQFRRAAYSAVDRIIAYYDNVHLQDVQAKVEPGYLSQLIRDSPPQDGEPWDEIEHDLENQIMPGLCHWTHPGFMAYFPASSTYEGILGELYSAAFNAPAFDWVCSPAVTELELAMVEWVASLLALPAPFRPTAETPAKGVIMSSTTECIISTMIAARDRAAQKYAADSSTSDRQDRSQILGRLVALGSSETHASSEKAASIVGVHYRSVSCSPVNGTALTGAQLLALIEECEREGLIPFYLTTTLGTTSSCAVDNFPEIQELISTRPDIWVHVDAAYAGAALACEEYQHLGAEIASFDSFSVNLGKWLLTNLDCTMLFLAIPEVVTGTLHNSFAIVEYGKESHMEAVNYRDWQLSMARRFRSLKIWFVLRSWGVRKIQQHIRRHIEMADAVTAWAQQDTGFFDLVCPTQFALSVVRVKAGWAEKIGLSVHEATIAVMEAVNQSGKFWLTKTAIDGCAVIRIIAANTKSTPEALQKLMDMLSLVVQDLVDKGPVRSVL